ncbi:MAG: class I SAM-dependent methyltransferase [Thermoanaerobacterales bacterium]|nr:class I SAM-dependent methyltransferase [Thermoanaerobacterales bacterium]
MTALFDPLAPTYDAWYETPLGRTVDRLERRLLFAVAEPRPGERALDAGCGTGRLIAELASLGLSLMGVDLSEAMLDVARDRTRGLANVTLQRGNVEALPLPAGQFDLVIAFNSLEFTPDPARAVEELWRLVRPGGRLVVAVLNSWSPWAWRRRRAARVRGGVFAHARFFSPPEITGLLRRTGGGEPIRWSSTVFIPPGAGPGWLAAADLCEAVGRVAARPFGALVIARMDRIRAPRYSPEIDLSRRLSPGHICRSST